MPITGQPYFDREVHHLADLLGEDLAQRAAEDREVLREDEDLAAEDRPVAGDDGVAVRAAVHHPEVRLAVADVAVELDERARVAELLGALAREQPPLVAPARDRTSRCRRAAPRRAARAATRACACVVSCASAMRRSLTCRAREATPASRAADPRLRVPLDVAPHERARVADARRRDRLAGLLDPPQPARPRPRRADGVPAAAAPRAAGGADRRPAAAPRGHRRRASCLNIAIAVVLLVRHARRRARSSGRSSRVAAVAGIANVDRQPGRARADAGDRARPSSCRARSRCAASPGQIGVIAGPALGGVIFAIEPVAVYVTAAGLLDARRSSRSSRCGRSRARS